MDNTTIMVMPQQSLNEQEAIKPTKDSQFMEANTTNVELEHLRQDCIIPTFKDNEQTISHSELIETTYASIQTLFGNQAISVPDIRVSHEIKGRIPEAIGKPVKDLLEHEKTIYWERCAFLFNLPNIRNVINGNELSLTIGGVRAYNQENLYSKKSMEKFKIFIGFQNKVCTNLCISTDGFSNEIRASNTQELNTKIVELIGSYNAQKHLAELDSLGDYELTEQQFAQFIGKARLYHYLPKPLKSQIPLLDMNDGMVGTIAKEYYDDSNFSRNDNGTINMWKAYNLFTNATKSSYIDSFLERTVNAYQLSKGLVSALNGDSKYSWFLG
jgi:hypothetical protein